MNNQTSHQTQSLFVTFEGGEGAGKTTLLQRIAAELTTMGKDVVTTREPGGSKLGDYIRQWLLNKDFDYPIGMKAELLLFLAARAQHIDECIQPALAAGKIVLCDRFNDSTVAYQGYARGLGAVDVQELCRIVCGSVIPQVTFFLDVDPLQGLSRSKNLSKENSVAGELDRIESAGTQFHAQVRKGFHWIAEQEPERFALIDASQSKDAVFNAAMNRINMLLN